MEVERTTQGRKAEKTPSVSPEPQNNCPVSQWVRRWQGSSGQGSVAWLGPGKQPDRSLILSRSKFLQGTAWNLTLVGAGGEGGGGQGGAGSWPSSGGGQREARHLSQAPETPGQKPKEDTSHIYAHLLQPQPQPLPQIKGHMGR